MRHEADDLIREMQNPDFWLYPHERAGRVNLQLGAMNISYPSGYFDYLHTPEYKAQQAKEEAKREANHKVFVARLHVKARQVVVAYGTLAVCLLAWGVARILVTL